MSHRPYRIELARVGYATLGSLVLSLTLVGTPVQGQVFDFEQEGGSLLDSTGLSDIEPVVDEAADAFSAGAPQPAPLTIDTGILDSLEATSPEEETTSVPVAKPGQEIEVIRERYANRRVKNEREVTLDADGNYVNHGSWKMWDEQGNLIAEGHFDMGRRTGRWTRWHRRGDSTLFNLSPFSNAQGPFISQASFIEGEMDGEWTIFDGKQTKLSRISFKNGRRHGPATLWLTSGQPLRQMNYKNGDLDGDVMELGKDAKLAKTATFQEGHRLAKKITHFKGSRTKQTEATYLFAKLVPKQQDDYWTATFAEYEAAGEDERHGPWTTWYPNGQIQVEGQFQNDTPVGKFTWWHNNGQKYSEGQYADGKQNGTWRWWHRNGQKWTQGDYENGVQVGAWASWREDGKLDQQATYTKDAQSDATATLPPAAEELAPLLQ